jgi:hypothetical protein
LFLPGASLSIVGDCLDMLGQPLIPVLLLVLGANLAAGPVPGHLPLHSVLTVVATRLVLLPLLGCAAVLGAQKSGLIDMQDPLALVVMMVAWSTPTGAHAIRTLEPFCPVATQCLGWLGSCCCGDGGVRLPVGCLLVLWQQAGLIDRQDPLALVVMMVAWSTPTGAHSIQTVEALLAYSFGDG